MSYRKNNPLPESKLANGLLVDGVVREAYVSSRKMPVNAETFTLRETADALGRSYLTVRKWILDGIIPKAVFSQSTTGYDLYHKEELQILAKIIHKHEKEFCYIHITHDQITNSIWQAIEHLRKNKRWV